MILHELTEYIRSDLFRYYGKCSFLCFFIAIITNRGFKISFFYRICHHFYKSKNKPMLVLFCIPYFHYRVKYGVDLPFHVHIGKGLYIGHVFSIAINRDCIIGKNVNISHEVTLGGKYRGERAGAPVVGNNVYIGPGVKIIGRLIIGDNAAIGANCVVTRDIPANAVVVGIPGKVISLDGSDGYIENIGY